MAMCSPRCRERPQVARRQRAGVLLHEDLALEICPVQIHVFVRIARVAVLAAKFASAIGIDRPAEGHALGIAAVQDRARRQQKILRSALGVGQRGRGGEACDAGSFGCLRWRRRWQPRCPGGAGRWGRDKVTVEAAIASLANGANYIRLIFACQADIFAYYSPAQPTGRQDALLTYSDGAVGKRPEGSIRRRYTRFSGPWMDP